MNKFVDATKLGTSPVKRIVTGGPWDAAWGGGLVAGSVTLLGGSPGGGKSTLVVQLAVGAHLQTKKPSYIVSLDDTPSLMAIVRRVAVPLKQGTLTIQSGHAHADLDNRMFPEPPGLIAFDGVSVSKYDQLATCKRLKTLAAHFRCPAVLTCHMTKEHDYHGLMALQHEADVLVTLFPEEDGHCSIRSWKNRFGPTHNETLMQMTERGFVAVPPKKKRSR